MDSFQGFSLEDENKIYCKELPSAAFILFIWCNIYESWDFGGDMVFVHEVLPESTIIREDYYIPDRFYCGNTIYFLRDVF